ncbi:MAG TPA: hypothetical protein ENH35_01025 [Candidatus Moranbacteria bacterium]|nr:hypothetical protein BMS3Abin13_00493 [bacterium BMS3Abin13]HDZ85116.1 hypothetical protein [Candidatus Moranbacteria bacterium]
MSIFGDSSNKLIKRCKKSKIEYDEQEENEEYDDFFSISLQAGRKKRNIYFEDEEEINEFLEIDFENYSFLDRYDAIYSPDNKIIEAMIYPLQGTTATLYRSILNYKGLGKVDRVNLSSLTIKDIKNEDHQITIGQSSKEFELLTQNKLSRARKFPYVTIKLHGFKVDQHVTAKKILEKLSQSIFFQIDLKYKIPINLSVYSTATPRFGVGFRGVAEIDYPKREFDEDALALYWYAKSAKKMPLQKFLAFYQVLEFYYPNFTKISAKKKVKNLLLDPSFNIDKDKDLNRILDIVESSSSSTTDERSQLYATLEECVASTELIAFFKPKTIRDFFIKKNKEITEVTIPLADKKADIIKSVASRVYDIRCRIVHTKDLSGTTKPLLPNSQGAENLHEDIKLLEFLAKKVIISASAPITI